MFIFVENIGQKYDFQGGGLWQGLGGPDPKKKGFNILLIQLIQHRWIDINV